MVMMPVAAASAAASVIRDDVRVNHRIRSESQAKGTRAVTLTDSDDASGPGYWKSVGHRDTGPGARRTRDSELELEVVMDSGLSSGRLGHVMYHVI
jgi:hypothetical protein